MWGFYVVSSMLAGAVTVFLLLPLRKTGVFAYSLMLFIPLGSLVVYALTGRPDLPSYRISSGGLLAREESAAALLAQKPLEALSRRDPRDIDALMTLGKICVRLRRYDEAEEFYRRARDIAREKKDPRETLAAKSLEAALKMER